MSDLSRGFKIIWYTVAINALTICSDCGHVYAQRQRPMGFVSQTGSENTMPVSESKGLMRELFNKVKDKLIIVQGDDGVGSGFIVEMEDGKKFFVTNKHVVEGQKRVAAFRLDGKEVRLGAFEVATNRDLVRFALPAATETLKAHEGTPNIHDSVYIFGNSDGKGVATDLSGKIVGVGPEDIEVSVPFVRGNSGSAVLNEQGEVVGVATYATRDTNPEDWTKQGSRFSDVRRFAVRFVNVEWRPMKYEAFYKICIEELRKRQQDAAILPQVSASFFNPVLKCAKQYGYHYVIKGNITLSMRGGTDVVKAPIVRLCALLKSNQGEYCFKDCILTKPGSQQTKASPPVYAYGNSSSGEYSTENGSLVFFLEGMSYHQRMFGLQRLGVQYFDKSSNGFQEYLFSIPDDVCGKKPPEIVCFRLECWQNGALAGVYNSKSPTALNGKGIPVDWFIRGKYPYRINYTLLN